MRNLNDIKQEALKKKADQEAADAAKRAAADYSVSWALREKIIKMAESHIEYAVENHYLSNKSNGFFRKRRLKLNNTTSYTICVGGINARHMGTTYKVDNHQQLKKLVYEVNKVLKQHGAYIELVKARSYAKDFSGEPYVWDEYNIWIKGSVKLP